MRRRTFPRRQPPCWSAQAGSQQRRKNSAPRPCANRSRATSAVSINSCGPSSTRIGDRPRQSLDPTRRCTGEPSPSSIDANAGASIHPAIAGLVRALTFLRLETTSLLSHPQKSKKRCGIHERDRGTSCAPARAATESWCPQSVRSNNRKPRTGVSTAQDFPEEHRTCRRKRVRPSYRKKRGN